eukprot:ANDGO_06798.mRNA.1 hypothetical protein GUITHDRAFT_48955
MIPQMLASVLVVACLSMICIVRATAPSWGNGNPGTSVSTLGSASLRSTGTTGFVAATNPTSSKLVVVYLVKTSSFSSYSAAVFNRNASATIFESTPLLSFPITTSADGDTIDPDSMGVTVFSDDSFVFWTSIGSNIRWASVSFSASTSTFSVANTYVVSNTAHVYYAERQVLLPDCVLIPTNRGLSSSLYEGLTIVPRNITSNMLMPSSNVTYGITAGDRKPCTDNVNPANALYQYAFAATTTHLYFLCGVCAGSSVPQCSGTYNLSFVVRVFRRLATVTSYDFTTIVQTVPLNIGMSISTAQGTSSAGEIFMNSNWLGVYVKAAASSTYQSSVFVYNFVANPNAPLQTAPSPVLSNSIISLASDESTNAPDSFSFGEKYLAFRVNLQKTAVFLYANSAFPALVPMNRNTYLNPSILSSGATGDTPAVKLQGDQAFGVTYYYSTDSASNRLAVFGPSVCPPGNSLSGTNVSNYDCTACSRGTFNTIGSTTCTLCPGALQYAPNVGTTSCGNCPPGHVATANRTACTPCEPGTSLNTVSGVCVRCDAGYSQALYGQENCQACAAGYYQSRNGATNCSACPAGTYNSETAKSSCTRCESGYYQNSTAKTSVNDCSPCELGYYTPVSSSASCTACAAGTYADRLGLTSCFQCEVGTYQPLTAQVSSFACNVCPLGTYGAASGSAKCLRCASGTYADSTGSTSCKTCPTDYRNTATGLTSSSACDAPDSNKIMLYSLAVGAFTSLTLAFLGLIFNRYFIGIKLVFYRWKVRRIQKRIHIYKQYVATHEVPAHVFSDIGIISISDDPSDGANANKAKDTKAPSSQNSVKNSHRVYPNAPPMQSESMPQQDSNLSASPVDNQQVGVYAGLPLDNVAIDAAESNVFCPQTPLERAEEYLDEHAKHVRLLEFQNFTQMLSRDHRPLLSTCISVFLFLGLIGSIVGLVVFSVLLGRENSTFSSNASSSTEV